MTYVISYLLSKLVRNQVKHFYGLGNLLSEIQIQELNSFFEPSLLSKVRLIYLEDVIPSRIHVRFYLLCYQMMFRLQKLAGLTLGPCIFLSQKTEDVDFKEVLFHELIHVVQYEELSYLNFFKAYIGGWVKNSFSYFKIPLEVQAYYWTKCCWTEKQIRDDLTGTLKMELRAYK